MAFELLLTLTGRLVVWGATLGRCRCDDLGSEDHRMHGASGTLWYARDGRKVVTTTGQLLVGLALLAALGLALWKLSAG